MLVQLCIGGKCKYATVCEQDRHDSLKKCIHLAVLCVNLVFAAPKWPKKPVMVAQHLISI